LTGDQNMIEVNATIHYRLKRPDDFLFRQADGETTVRTAAESAMESVIASTGLDSILTTDREELETRIRTMLQIRLEKYTTGVEVYQVKLLDVHPSVEVVEAFREVSGAFEEKNRLINEAEGYRNEQVALARGNAQARLRAARGESLGRVNRATGDAARFTLTEAEARNAQAITETRMYLETMEQILPGRKKLVVDATRGRRHLMMVDDGVQIGPAILSAPRPAVREQEQERD
jgi:HflK protein